MPTRDRGRQHTAEYAQLKAQLLELAEESKSVLLELGSALNQRYGKRAPDHPTQQLFRRKNEAVNRLREFMAAPGFYETGDGVQHDTYDGQQQRVIERLQKQLADQSAAFEVERQRLQQQQQLTSGSLTTQSELNSSLERIMPHLRGLLHAYDREHGQHATKTRPQTVTAKGQPSNHELTQRLREMQTKFDAERADLLEQASEAVNAQVDISHEILAGREAALTCPISLDLFEDPVVTTCCGKTFSSGVLHQALRRSNYCPFCRAHNVSTHTNRDMANLVELHRAERLVLGLPESVATSAPAATTDLVAEEAQLVQEIEHRRQVLDLMSSENSHVAQLLETALRDHDRARPRSGIDHQTIVFDSSYYDSDY
ncbi:unnamed protein product [Hyaloperonospora brassicae]|uniref:RING-type domain-containing protein n=1 Tax=Hyaloperonospora brassicae TaxID=162125 RepID=A0AAV0T5G7_HYABA|nr:unnamed protein product [Hyaloperonospora brassicae]